jgi:RES domain-containing protein
MPAVWRLSAPAYSDILNGEGNRLTGARWNSPGRGVVYTSENLSLSVLETYVHVPPEARDSLPELTAVRLQIPDDVGIARISTEELQRMLGASDPQSACRAAGDRWLATGTDLVLAAPSVVIPEERNLMINPDHPRMNEVRIVSRRPFRFDPRLATAKI